MAYLVIGYRNGGWCIDALILSPDNKIRVVEILKGCFLKFENDVYMHKNKNGILKIPSHDRGYSSPCIWDIYKPGFAVSPEAGALCLSSGPCSSAYIRLGCSRAGGYRRCRRKEPLPPQPRAARKHSNLELSTRPCPPPATACTSPPGTTCVKLSPLEKRPLIGLFFTNSKKKKDGQ